LRRSGCVGVYQGDVADGQDALAVSRFPAPVVTNVPFSKESKRLMHALVRHFLATAPYTWLIWPADFMHHKSIAPYLPMCTTIVRTGRICWFGGDGFDHAAWFRFQPDHRAGPVFAAGAPTESLACEKCGRSFVAARSEACSATCRQKAYRARLSVTHASCAEV